MRRLVLLLALLVSACSTFKAPPTEVSVVTRSSQSYQGYDVLAVAKYCDLFLKAPKLPAVSTLLNTFGDPLPCIEKRIKQGGLEVVQVDLIDATCWRNHSCAPGVPKPDDLKVIKARAQKIQPLASRYPAVQFWVSPALEDDVRDATKKKAMLQAAQAGCPSCRVINSPFTGAQVPGYPIEKHGTKVRGFSVSGDGASSFDGDNLGTDGNDFQHRISGSYSTFIWWNELNLRCTGEEHAPPPNQRTNRPTMDQFKQGYQIAQPEQVKPPAPSVCKSIRKLSGGELHKPNAEAYCNGQSGAKDPRGNRPLLIIRKPGRKGDKIRVMSSSGKIVGCYAYYGPYSSPGLHRWYMGDCSNQRPAELMASLGSEWGFVPIGNGSCLQINAVRRSGTYR